MSSICSMLTLGNALAEIAAGYAKLHQGSGSDAAGLGAAMQQILQSQGSPDAAQQQTGDALGIAADTDTYEFSQTAMDYAFAYKTQQLAPAPASHASTDIGIAPATQTNADAIVAALTSHHKPNDANPFPTIQSMANINDLYQAGNYAACQNLNVYA